MRAAPIDINWAEAKTFLTLLGKNGDSRFRAFAHKSAPAEVKRKLARKFGREPQPVIDAQADGLGVYVVINDGGDTKSSITACRAFFAEFDGVDEAEQWELVNQSGLPEPSIVVATGGGSLHFYWVLAESMADTKQWQADMRRLAAHLGSDPSINDPSRVMRLPGCWYMDGDGQPVAQVSIVHQSDARYSRGDVIGCLPELEPELPKTATTPLPLSIHTDAERTERRALEQLQRIPPRVPGTNTREIYLRLFWGLVAITGPERAAQLMAQHSPEWAATDDLLTLARDARGDISDATFFEIAKRAFNLRSPEQPHTHEAVTRYSVGSTGAVDPDDFDLDQEGLSIAELLDLSERLAESRQLFTLEALLPADLAAAVELLHRPLPTDPLSATLPLLCGFTGLAKLGTQVQSSLTFTRPINLFVASVMRSGGAKTPIKNTLVDNPAKEIRKAAARQHRQEMENWKQIPPKERGDAPKPLFPHLSDYTPAALSEQLQRHEDRRLGLLVIADELSGLLQAIAQDTKQGSGNGDRQLLEAFDGEGFSSIRIGAAPRSYEQCHLSIYGNIQPDLLRELINGNDTTGKFARFLFVRVPSTPLQLSDADPTEAELEQHLKAEQVLRQYAEAIHALPPRTYCFEQEGRRRFHAWFLNYNARALSPGCPSVISALLGKTSAHAIRIAGALHLLRVVSGEANSKDPIPAATVDQAMAIVDQLIQETEAFHEIPETPQTLAIRHIHALSFNSGKPVSRVDAKATAGRHLRTELTAAHFEASITELEHLGYGSVQRKKQLNGKTSITYLATREMR